MTCAFLQPDHDVLGIANLIVFAIYARRGRRRSAFWFAPSVRAQGRPAMSNTPIIEAFFDEPTNTVTYLVADPETGEAAVIDPVMDYDHNDGSVDARSAQEVLAAAAIARMEDRLGARNPRPRGSPFGRPLHQGQDWRAHRHRRTHHGRSAHLPPRLQRHRPEDRRQRLRPSVQGRRDVRDRQSPRGSDACARAHASRHRLQGRRRGVRRRHPVHARLRHRARRLPRRRRAPALSLDPAHSLPSRQHAALHVPRLQGAGTG